MRPDDTLLRDFLLDSGLVSRSQMGDVLERLAGEEGTSLTTALARAGLLEHDELRRAQAHALGVPFVELDPHDIQEEAMILIPEPLARARNVFAFSRSEAGLEVLALDLADLDALGDVARAHRILPRLTSESSMRRALQHYQKHLKEKFGEIFAAGRHLTDALINHALYSRAGGVHIDHGSLGTLVRYQIGHALHEAFVLPEQLGKQLVLQLKSFAKLLPVTRPQEGKFKVGHGDDVVHVRVHTLPGEGGDPSRRGGVEAERVHLRLARASQGARGYTLETLGLHGEGLEAVERFLSRRCGLLAVVGDEGSGKTTLLRTLEDLLVSPHTTLLRLPAQAGTDSAASLRAALRHDPDVIVLDDVADEASYALAHSAASRGTMVIAGVDPSLDLVGDLTIRLALVRRLCTKAFTDTTKLSRSEHETLGQYADFTRILTALKDEYVIAPNVAWKDVVFAKATPCGECQDGPDASVGAGYQGRIGLMQVEEGGALVGLNLVEDGLFKAAQNLTSLDEILALIS